MQAGITQRLPTPEVTLALCRGVQIILSAPDGFPSVPLCRTARIQAKRRLFLGLSLWASTLPEAKERRLPFA